MELQRCLHVTNRSMYENVAKGDLGYDKFRQIGWLVNAIYENFMGAWHLEKTLIVDEMMIRYKGTYLPIWQYMSKKQQK